MSLQAADQPSGLKAAARARAVAVSHIAVVVAAAVAVEIGVIATANSAALVHLDCLLVTLFAGWAVVSWMMVSRSMFNPYGIFLISVIAFNASQAILVTLGLNQGGLLAGIFTDATLHQTLLLVLWSLAAMHLGALLAATRGGALASRRVLAKRTVVSSDALTKVGLSLLLVSVVPSALAFRDAVLTVQSAGYIGLYARQVPSGLLAGPQVLAAYLVPGALFLLAGSAADRRKLVISGAAVLAYSVLEFLLGYRLFAVAPLVAWAWFYHRRVGRINPLALVAGASLLVFVVFPVVGATRDLSGAARATVDYGNVLATLGNPALATISEMGTSMQTIAYTVLYVPNIRPFDFGSGYVLAALTVVSPYSWWQSLFGTGGTYSAWLVGIVDPQFAAQGGGLGFSFIAEAFANFGWFGIAVGYVVGFAIVRFSAWAEEFANPGRLAIVASYMTFFLIFARGESVSVLRPLIWYAIVPYLVAVFLTWRASRVLVPARVST